MTHDGHRAIITALNVVLGWANKRYLAIKFSPQSCLLSEKGFPLKRKNLPSLEQKHWADVLTLPLTIMSQWQQELSLYIEQIGIQGLFGEFIEFCYKSHNCHSRTKNFIPILTSTSLLNWYTKNTKVLCPLQIPMVQASGAHQSQYDVVKTSSVV